MNTDSADGVSPRPHNEDPPLQVGPYVVIRRLGHGGIGVVHLARDRAGRLVALKVMRPEIVEQEGFERRFRREVEAARRVARFCTAPVLDAGMHDGVAYLVTEFIDGPDLSRAVAERGPLNGSELEGLAVGTAVALTAIHRAGVVHRDVTPSNVLLGPLGPRLIDFGIAQLADTLSPSSRPVIGTPAFMAPEQAAGEAGGPASDVFAWGGLIVYAGTGRLPFGGGSAPDILYRVVHEGPVLDGLHGPLRGLVESALAKDPARRPTAQQLLDELVGQAEASTESAEHALTRTWGSPVNPVPSGPVSSGGTGDTSDTVRSASGFPPRRRRILALVAAAVLVVLAGGLVWITGRGELAFRDGFEDTSSGWATGTSAAGESGYDGGRYRLRVNPGWVLWKSAPVRAGDLADVHLRATTAEVAGAADYGLWCRGRPAGVGTSRYQFHVTGDGRVAITKRRASGAPVELFPYARSPVAPSSRAVIEADCRDRPGGVELRMSIDGALVAQVVDRDAPYPPGDVGVHATAGRRQSASVEVRFESFEATETGSAA